MSQQHNSLDNSWLQNQPGKPLFPDLIWSRPEHKASAGKLLIIGGNSNGFTAPAEAFRQSQSAGIGEVRVLLPDALKRTVGKLFVAGQFAPSTTSGGFSQKALAELLIFSDWPDGILLAGDLGRNSETAILIEKFITSFKGQLSLTNDAVDFLITSPDILAQRTDLTIIINLAQLQKLATNLAFSKAFTSSLDLLRLVGILKEFSLQYQINLIFKQLDYILVASEGQVSSTKMVKDQLDWQIKAAAYASVWWLQDKQRTFQALTTAIYTAFQVPTGGQGGT